MGKIPENRFLLVCYTYGIKQLQLTQYSDHDHLYGISDSEIQGKTFCSDESRNVDGRRASKEQKDIQIMSERPFVVRFFWHYCKCQ